MYYSFTVSNDNKNFSLVLEERSRFRDTVQELVDAVLCVPFGHATRFSYSICTMMINWAEKPVKHLYTLPITDKQASLVLRSESDYFNAVMEAREDA